MKNTWPSENKNWQTVTEKKEKERTMKKRMLSMVLALAMMLTLVACGGDKGKTESSSGEMSSASESVQAGESSSEKEPAKEQKTVRVAYMPNMGSASSLFTAIDQGYFDEVGLKVEVAEFEGGPAEITAMASGDIDIAQIGHGAHALCIEGQACIFQMDSTNSLADEVVANKEKGITKAEDLKGKTVAVASGTSSEVILKQILAKANMTEDDIKVVEMAVDGMTTALVAGQIDAAATWSPNTVTLKKSLGDNYVSLGSNADFADKATFPASFITTKEYAEKNKDVLVRFSAAINKAHVYREANIEEVAKSLAKHLDAPEETMVASVGEGDWATINKICGDMEAVKKVYEIQQNVFMDSGRIKEKVDPNSYVLFDVMEEGYKTFNENK